jgi:hypothetical protein
MKPSKKWDGEKKIWQGAWGSSIYVCRMWKIRSLENYENEKTGRIKKCSMRDQKEEKRKRNQVGFANYTLLASRREDKF